MEKVYRLQEGDDLDIVAAINSIRFTIGLGVSFKEHHMNPLPTIFLRSSLALLIDL